MKQLLIFFLIRFSFPLTNSYLFICLYIFYGNLMKEPKVLDTLFCREAMEFSLL